MADSLTSTAQWRAVYRYARLSPRKARLVCDLIRGKKCSEALEILQFNAKRPALDIAKTLKSAMANADEQEADMGRLFIKEIRVDNGPTFPRWRPKDRGRAHMILKKTCHINVVLAQDESRRT